MTDQFGESERERAQLDHFCRGRTGGARSLPRYVIMKDCWPKKREGALFTRDSAYGALNLIELVDRKIDSSARRRRGDFG